MNYGRISFRSSAILAVVCACLFDASISSAGMVSYLVTTDTSGITGSAGFLEFEFNPATTKSLSATASVANFQTDGTLTTTYPNSGDASGALPATLAFDNGTPFNDVYQGFTYGTTVSFLLTLSGSAIGSTPPGTQFGSTFSFFVEDSNSNPLSNSLSGDAADFAINPDGSITPSANLPLNPNGPIVTIESSNPQAVPEPATLLLVQIGIWAFFFFHRQARLRGHSATRVV